MNIKQSILISLLTLNTGLFSQKVSHVYKINSLLERIKSPDTLYVVNFWATWCKPCVQELPAFDSLAAIKTNPKQKVLMVSLDFKEDLGKKVNPFLKKRNIRTECVLLDEINGNDYIDLISESWSGAIPATLLKFGNKTIFLQKKLKLIDLQAEILNLQSK